MAGRPPGGDIRAMDAQEQRLDQPKTPERAPAAERLETALGGDLTRFLLTALAKPKTALK